jgi:hypothetical protein
MNSNTGDASTLDRYERGTLWVDFKKSVFPFAHFYIYRQLMSMLPFNYLSVFISLELTHLKKNLPFKKRYKKSETVSHLFVLSYS